MRDGVKPMELGLVHQLFGQACAPTGEPLYEVLTCAPRAGMVLTDADFPVVIEHGPATVAAADTVIVPAARHDEEAFTGGLPEPLAATLRRIRPGARVASACTGAFVLAAAGWLDGRRATTHWKSVAALRRLRPQVAVEPDVLYVDEGNVLTSAGEAAGVDLCLHMLRTDHGASVANEVARTTVVAPHREGGQAQYVRLPVPEPARSGTAAARAWALANLHEPVSLRGLAACESMSVRTFTRRFRAEVGLSPGQWLLQQRRERARQLLEETDLPIERVAVDSGFSTAASLRHHLRAALGVSPNAYRATFRGARVGPRGGR